jgi:hypothetical protein
MKSVNIKKTFSFINSNSTQVMKMLIHATDYVNTRSKVSLVRTIKAYRESGFVAAL